MKGTKKIEINGKDVSLKFDFGAVVLFTSELGIKLSEMDTALDDASNTVKFIQLLADRGGSKLTEEDIYSIDFDKLNEVFELVQESAGNLTAPKKGKK